MSAESKREVLAGERSLWALLTHIIVDVLGLEGVICVFFLLFCFVYVYPQRNESNWSDCYTAEDVLGQERLIDPSKALPTVRSFTPCLSALLGKGRVLLPSLAWIQSLPVYACVCMCAYLNKLYLGYLNIFEPCLKTAVSNYSTSRLPC